MLHIFPEIPAWFRFIHLLLPLLDIAPTAVLFSFFFNVRESLDMVQLSEHRGHEELLAEARHEVREEGGHDTWETTDERDLCQDVDDVTLDGHLLSVPAHKERGESLGPRDALMVLVVREHVKVIHLIFSDFVDQSVDILLPILKEAFLAFKLQIRNEEVDLCLHMSSYLDKQVLDKAVIGWVLGKIIQVYVSLHVGHPHLRVVKIGVSFGRWGAVRASAW